MIQVIVFDFDGVIIDSAHIKDQAFLALFSELAPEAAEKAIDYINRTKGQFRRKRILNGFKEIFGINLSESELDIQYNKFSDLVIQSCIQAPFIRGAMEFFNTPHHQHLYVVSAAPQDEVKYIMKKRDISQFFKDISGGPVKKTLHLQRIANEENVNKNEILFIGDALPDYQAAMESGVSTFLGVVPVNKENPFPGHVDVLGDLMGIYKHI